MCIYIFQLYPRWTDRRNNRDQLYDAKTQKPIDSIHFQVIPTTSQQQTINLSNQQNSIRTNLSTDNSTNTNNNNSTNNNTNSNSNNNMSHLNNLNNSQLNVNTQIAVSETTLNHHLTTTSSNRQNESQQIIVSSNGNNSNNQLVTGSSTNNNASNDENDVNISTQNDNRHLSHILTNQQLHQLHQSSNDNLVSQRSLNSNCNTTSNNRITINNVATTSAPPLLLSLSQVSFCDLSFLALLLRTQEDEHMSFNVLMPFQSNSSP